MGIWWMVEGVSPSLLVFCQIFLSGIFKAEGFSFATVCCSVVQFEIELEQNLMFLWPSKLDE